MPTTPVLPDQFYTLQSMLTLAGSTGATFVICNGLQRAFDFNPRWLALAVSMALVLIGTYFSGKTAAVEYFIGFINGFLVYCTAAGATAIGGGGGGGGGPVARGAAEAVHPLVTRRRFLSPWF